MNPAPGGPLRISAPSNHPDLRILRQMQDAQCISLALIGLIATAVLGGWLVPAIGAALPFGWSLMKANTALAFLLGAASMVLTQPRWTRPRRIESRICAALVMIIAGAALAAHLGGRGFGLETLLAADPGAEMTGRMSIQTAAFLCVAGVILLFDGAWNQWRAHVADALTLALIAFILVLIAGYALGAANLFGQTPYTRTSPQTLACMVLLGTALTARRTQSGFFSVLVGVGIGSQIARLAWPVMLLLPLEIVGGAAYAITSGWLTAPYAMALAAAMNSTLLLVIFIAMARRINDLERGLRDASLSDELTHLQNRRGFYLLGEHALHETRRSGETLRVLFFDLDGLKTVNDTLGHEAGSRLLLDFANLLREAFRDSDVVARLGGDEFTVLTHAHEAGVRSALRRLEAATAGANATGGKSYRVSYSVGTAAADPGAEESFDQLVKRADALMYQEKQSKKQTPATPLARLAIRVPSFPIARRWAAANGTRAAGPP